RSPASALCCENKRRLDALSVLVAGIWAVTGCPARYEERLFLRLLECYVLDAIGELNPDQALHAGEDDPESAAHGGVTVTWSEIVAAQMQFPANLATSLREMWHRNLAMAQEQGYCRLFAVEGVGLVGAS